MWVMEERFGRAALALALVLCAFFLATEAEPDACHRPSAGDLILGPSAMCFPSELLAAGTGFEGVFEGDEITLQRAISIVNKNREQYIAVLFYSSWCPFSKICRPKFNVMPSLFPTIPHFAFEGSVIRPSILSRRGVHGFPTLFLLNSSMRVRYHGPRSIYYFTSFYSDVTGVKPVQAISDKIINVTNLVEDIWGDKQEDCPFSWARSPENLLQQDAYLALASSFVLLRLLYFLLPKLSSCIKRAWGRQLKFPSLISLCEYSQAFLEQVMIGFSRLNPGKRTNLQEGAMNAKAWVSKSLVSVSVSEPSSGRASPHQ